MSYYSKRKTIAALLIVLSLFSSSCSDSKDQGVIRIRRSEVNSTSTSTTVTESKSRSTVLNSTETVPITQLPLLSPQEISATWTEQTLCPLVGKEFAQQLLDMRIAPDQKYVFKDIIGARCTFSSSLGDEVSVEISVSSYDNARAIDSAIESNKKPIVIDGITGVVSSATSSGATIELNISGGASNQWRVNAPNIKQARSVASRLISQLV